MNPKKNLRRLMVRLEPKQIQALRTEALRRMKDAERHQLDVSEVVREAVAEWMRRR